MFLGGLTRRFTIVICSFVVCRGQIRVSTRVRVRPFTSSFFHWVGGLVRFSGIDVTQRFHVNKNCSSTKTMVVRCRVVRTRGRFLFGRCTFCFLGGLKVKHFTRRTTQGVLGCISTQGGCGSHRSCSSGTIDVGRFHGVQGRGHDSHYHHNGTIIGYILLRNFNICVVNFFMSFVIGGYRPGLGTSYDSGGGR